MTLEEVARLQTACERTILDALNNFQRATKLNVASVELTKIQVLESRTEHVADVRIRVELS